MKNTKLSGLSIDELTKEDKKRSAIFISYCIIIGIMIGASIYATIKNGFSVISLLSIFFIPMYLIIWNNYREVRKEIRSRKSN
ncbi:MULTISPECIES: hypothetical protein [Chryseobacterium]|jgi:hypothetical protein|uniref:FUSC family protein n=1 Tax=Chryseobacterium rhizosphaerae TaxID=395937 RepID=A0AAE4C0X5_9FLAO|nr:MULTISPECIES: hypothetical protein [Chryseobacterium]MDC8100114.1 hypothetical protein [Chryseobacterium rhizosphaerae]MDR6524943.1 hypothetical protein [Chryseobacterium rhizosphaerae]REC73611.1 hypothetical protein DRF57_17060 [Chryseobacterium rhizosphaerae]GEN69358.1 hypothetical protein CRH01_39260 [Chryseobacterium rhizosphaerae]